MPLFLQHGYEGVSIDQLMAAAELTRGGFYAHFKSKQDLFAAMLGQDYGLPKKLRQARLGELGPDIKPEHAMAYYLSPENRHEISRSCPMASQASDVSRGGEPVRLAYTEQLKSLVVELQKHTPDRATALVTAATAVGAVSIASALNDEALAEELLEAVATTVLANF